MNNKKCFMLGAFPVSSLFFSASVFAAGEVTTIYAEEVDGDSDAAENQYSADGDDYQWGEGRNLKITGFRYNNKDYDYRSVADNVVIRRVDNDQSSGERCTLFAERDGGDNQTFLPDYADDGTGTGNCDMAAVMGGRIINRGVLDLFANLDNSWHSHKNVERVDFITVNGIIAPVDADDLAEAGHVATEKSGNNPVQIAAILSLDNDGNPSGYGDLVTVKPASENCNGICFGITNIRTTNAFLLNEVDVPHGGAYYLGSASTENLGMAFISLEDLGIEAGQTYFGFSYFGTDVDAALHNLTDPSSFPLDSEGQTSNGPGQADVYGGTAGVFVEESVEIEIPEPEDDDSEDDDSEDDDSEDDDSEDDDSEDDDSEDDDSEDDDSEDDDSEDDDSEDDDSEDDDSEDGDDPEGDNSNLVAPNMMIIFGNAWSMNRMMDDQALPSLDLDGDGSNLNDRYRFDDIGYTNNPVDGDHGTFYTSNLYANQDTSKLYQSKLAFKEILENDEVSASINLGIATFRQTFGLPVSTVDYLLNRSWPRIYPSGGQPADPVGYRSNPASPNDAHPDYPNGNPIYTASTPEKNTFSQDVTNFSYVAWNRQWFNWSASSTHDPACAYTNYAGSPRYGNPENGGDDGKYYEFGRGFLDDDFSEFFDHKDSDGGLPKTLRAPADAIDQNYLATECNAGNNSWPWAVSNGKGARSAAEAEAGTAVLEHSLCSIYYNSQLNIFQATYSSERPFINSYPGKWGGYSLFFMTPGERQLNNEQRLVDRNGADSSDVVWNMSCSYEPLQRDAYTTTLGVSDEFIPYGPLSGNQANEAAYFSLSSSYYEGESSARAGAQLGALTGWSGENAYTLNSDGSETMTTSYPSAAADPCRSDRNLCPDTDNDNDPDKTYRYVKTMGADLPDNPRHMGVFLNLPTPAAGYVDQRQTLQDFMAFEQMEHSGSAYNPDSQTISGERGITTSSHPWYGYQSPVYQSLFGALAYYNAYKAADPYDDCGRTNHILLFYDGKEDARWTWDENGNKVYVQPEEMAARLYSELEVQVHVVILSNNAGDIAQANLIAENGGTGEALAVGSLEQLKDALTEVFATIKQDASLAAPAVPQISNAGDYAYEVLDRYNPDNGQLVAYALNSNGLPNTESPVWSADDGVNITVARRKSLLNSTDADGDIVNFFSDLDDAVFATGSNPSVATIREYTMNPSYSDGAYLGGRTPEKLIGLIGDTAPVLLDIPRNSGLFTDPVYRTYMQAQQSRNPLVLMTSQDGFLYAHDAATGALKWGWMPRQFVPNLKNFNLFDDNDPFDGHINVVTAKNADGDYGTYVVGSGAQGKLHFTLKLDDSANDVVLGSSALLWEEYVAGISPNNAASVIWQGNDTGLTFMVYTNQTVSGATLKIRNITDPDSAPLSINLSTGQIASTILVVKEKDGFTYLYIGSEDGQLLRYKWTDYTMLSTGSLVEDNNFSSGEIELGASEPIRYIGYSRYSGSEFLRLQSLNRFTVLKRAATSDDWSKAWSTFAGGAADYRLSPPETNKIQQLADGSQISAEALIVMGGVILPVYESSNAEQACSIGDGYLYFFDLDKGLFPNNRFTINGTTLVDSDSGEEDQLGANNPKLFIGSGRIHRPKFGVFDGQMSIYGHTEDSSYARVGVINSPIGSQNWREIRQ